MPNAPATTPPDDLDRRVRLYHIGERNVFDLITGMAAGMPEFVNVPRFDLPTGAKIVGSPYHDFYSRSFVFVVQHPSFDPVPEGYVIPRDDKPAMYEVVRLAAAPRELTAHDPDSPVVVHAEVAE